MTQADTNQGGAPTATPVQRAIDALIAPSEGTQAPAEGSPTIPTPGAPVPQDSDTDAASQASSRDPKVPPEFKESLADLIRKQREERQARQHEAKRAQDLQAKVQELEEKLSRSQKADLLADPIGFAHAHGLNEQEMALIGQAMLYNLVPDKAPPDLRVRLLEAKMAREKRADETKRQAEERKAAEARSQQNVQQYAAVVKAAVQSFGEADFPTSKAWFGGNHDEYTESLMHTANNIAVSAQAHGQVADLSPKAVAAVLERDIASRAARFKPQQQATQQGGQPGIKPPASGKQPAVLSTRGQGGTPTPPAMTEEERMRRALAVAFTDG